MAVDVSSLSFSLDLMGALVDSAVGARQDLAVAIRQTFTDGSGANQAGNARVVKSGAVAASGTASIDMAGWSDFRGNTVNPTNIKLLVIVVTAVSASGGNLAVTGGASNNLTCFTGTSQGVKIFGKGCFVLGSWEEGMTVTAGTGDLALLTATGADFTYDLYAVVGV